ncbi:DUF6416 domain-containing protein [Micromonospora chokoriensis]
MDITVPVPDNRVPEFYQMFGEWLAGKKAASSEEDASLSDQDDDDLLEWSAGDIDPARQVWTKLTSPAKAIFRELMSNPNVRFSGDDLAERLFPGKDSLTVAGYMSWPAKHCYTVGRGVCWQYEYPNGPTGKVVYSMDEVLATLFKRAARQ